MIKKIVIFFSIIFFAIIYSHSDKLCDLPEIMKRPRLYLGENHFFVVEFREAKIHMYSKNDYTHLLDFGNKGEGPGEFKYGPSLHFDKDQVIAFSSGKLSYFSYQGELIKEKRVPPRIRIRKILDNNYVATKSIIPKDIKGLTVIKSKIMVLDDQLNEVNEIFALQRGFMISVGGATKPNLELVRHYEGFDVFQNSIIIGNTKKGFYFDVRDLSGKKLYEINLPYNKRKVTEEDKKRLIEDMKEQLKQNRFFTSWKEYSNAFNKIVFLDYFPAYYGFKIFGDYIYVMTHNKEAKKREWIILDKKGKILKKVFLPSDHPHYIQQNKFYYIMENEDEEMWELHVHDLD
jgi:hypothetical protein